MVLVYLLDHTEMKENHLNLPVFDPEQTVQAWMVAELAAALTVDLAAALAVEWMLAVVFVVLLAPV